MRLLILTPFVLLVCLTFVKAHGDLDLRITAITKAIGNYPDSASLYFKRGKLRFQHEEYQASIDDLNTSLQKGFFNDLQNIYLAKSFYKLKKNSEAHFYLDKYLELNPGNVVAFNLKGRILYSQKQYEKSALYFENVIQLTIKSLPENYLEAAQSWNATSNPDKAEKAIGVLELGLKNLGPIITIQNKLIETHLNGGNSDRAIDIQLSIIEKTKRKESAFFKLAEIYLQLKEPEKAIEAAQSAKLHLGQLPNRIRKNSAMKALNIEIEQMITKTQQFR